MGTNPSGESALVLPRRRLFTGLRFLFALGLFLLLVVCVVFTWMTRGSMAQLPSLQSQALVDLHSWHTAQALASLAVTNEEAEYAREAQRLADHDGDQAFSAALRQASTQSHALTGDARALLQRISELQDTVKDDQASVQSLTRAASPSTPVDTASDLDIAKAQLALDSDQLAEAQQDLARTAGDERSKIQLELAAHEAAMRAYDAQLHGGNQPALVGNQHYGTLASLLAAWMDQRSRRQLIQQGLQQAQTDVAALTTRHNQLEAQANAAASARVKAPASRDRSTELASLKGRSAERQLLGIYDDRIQTQQQLASVYRNWAALVEREHAGVLGLLLRSVALIAFILLCVLFFDGLVRHLLDRPTLDRRRMQTLRVISVLGIQFAGALLVLFVIFGFPREMPTILGLTTAGLTVVLQDFIIAFFGWFVLMSKNGIRVGDWVEINGVGGEVVEIGLFRTAMLETGNWTDSGHPTGRRVTFINSFAIKGQYFNFSTTGQWMWDEIAVTIPAGEDTYEVIELIRKAVLKATEKDARLAEGEWNRVARQNRHNQSQFTACPAVELRPSASGIAVVARYVTRAPERFEMRNRLYQCVIDLLHKPVPTTSTEKDRTALT